MNTPILHLNLKAQWFDMIASGEKKEEYREVKPHWAKTLGPLIKIKGFFYHPSDVQICFSNGYSKNRRQMIINCKQCVVRRGKAEWGAKEGEIYYTLVLGEIVSKNF